MLAQKALIEEKEGRWGFAYRIDSQSSGCPQSGGGSRTPQMFWNLSSAIPNSNGRSRLANTTRASADLLVSCTRIVILAPSSRGAVVFSKAP